MDNQKKKDFQEYTERKERCRIFYAQVQKGFFKELNLTTLVRNTTYDLEMELYDRKLLDLDNI